MKHPITNTIATMLVVVALIVASLGPLSASADDKCVERTLGAGVATVGCAAAIAAAVTTCGLAPFVVIADFGITTGFCGALVCAAAWACGVTIPEIVTTVRECLLKK